MERYRGTPRCYLPRAILFNICGGVMFASALASPAMGTGGAPRTDGCTANPLRWSRVRRCSVIVLLLAVTTVALPTLTPEAAADEAAYLSYVGNRYRFLNVDELLSMGHRACAIVDQGNTASFAMSVLADEHGIAVPDAEEIVRSALVNLDC